MSAMPHECHTTLLKCSHRLAVGDAVGFCILPAGHEGIHGYSDGFWEAA